MITLHQKKHQLSQLDKRVFTPVVMEEEKMNNTIHTTIGKFKKNLIPIILLCLLFSPKSFGQTRAEILDAQTLLPIPYTLITLSNGNQIESDHNGKFSFSTAASDAETLTIRHNGYHAETFLFIPNPDLQEICFLLKKTENPTMKSLYISERKTNSILSSSSSHKKIQNVFCCNCLHLLISKGFDMF